MLRIWVKLQNRAYARGAPHFGRRTQSTIDDTGELAKSSRGEGLFEMVRLNLLEILSGRSS
jgi:hypothetical protein